MYKVSAMVRYMNSQAKGNFLWLDNYSLAPIESLLAANPRLSQILLTSLESVSHVVTFERARSPYLLVRHLCLKWSLV